METTPTLPANCHMGSDGRPHHEFGFSFVATVEKCAGARRSHVSAPNLIQAGERGVELHFVTEELAKLWAERTGTGTSLSLLEIFEQCVREGKFKLSISDTETTRRTVTELSPFFHAEPGMLFGTEEMIELRDSHGEVISLGYYDIFLKLGKTVLIVDNKFVRKEVEAAEKNRQGHCLAVAVWQAYPDVEDVVVLFCMPDLESSMHRFNRTEDEQRLTQELEGIMLAADQPFKTLQVGDHCVYCKFRGTCKAAIGAVETMVTGINPLAIPASGWAPHLIKSAEDMTILRYWGDTLLPIIEAIKEESVKWAQNGQSISAVVNGQLIEYKMQSRALPRQLSSAVEIYEEVKDWMPPEAMLSACKPSVTGLESVVVALISDRLIAEGKTPNAKTIAEDFTKRLQEKGLLTREEGRTFFLKRVKASARKKKGELPELNEGLAGPSDFNES